jgi:hypothetical protein
LYCMPLMVSEIQFPGVAAWVAVDVCVPLIFRRSSRKRDRYGLLFTTL